MPRAGANLSPQPDGAGSSRSTTRGACSGSRRAPSRRRRRSARRSSATSTSESARRASASARRTSRTSTCCSARSGSDTLSREQLGRLLRAGAGGLQGPAVPDRARSAPTITRRSARTSTSSSTRRSRSRTSHPRSRRFAGFLDAARVSTLKLRGAWGQAGRAPTAFSAPQTYTVNSVTLGTATGSAIRTVNVRQPRPQGRARHRDRARVRRGRVQRAARRGLHVLQQDDDGHAAVRRHRAVHRVHRHAAHEPRRGHEQGPRDLAVRHAGPDARTSAGTRGSTTRRNANELVSFGVRRKDSRNADRAGVRVGAAAPAGLPVRRLLGDSAAPRTRMASALLTRGWRRAVPRGRHGAPLLRASPRRRARSGSRTRSRSSATSASTPCSTTRAATTSSTRRSGTAASANDNCSRTNNPARAVPEDGGRHGAVQGARGVPQRVADARVDPEGRLLQAARDLAHGRRPIGLACGALAQRQ